MKSPQWILIFVLMLWILPTQILGEVDSISGLLPDSLYGYKLHRILSGEEADAVVTRLHQKKVTQYESEIGIYKGEKDVLLIYITHYPEAKEAEKEYKRMTEKISANPDFGFIMGEYLDFDGKQVFRCFGQGQTHFVFTHDQALLWISVNTMISRKFMEAYLKRLNQRE